MALVIGLQKTFNLFFQRRKLRGTIPFFIGIGLVLFGWTKIGILVEGFGFVNLFGCASLEFPQRIVSRTMGTCVCASAHVLRLHVS